jgi:mRNA-degrading endonuclease RelE of RelBE toxin-antitoxin system
MPFLVTITPAAEKHFRSLPARDRRILHAEILVRLQNQPTTETKAVKRLRPNPFAQFELRARGYRVLYNIEGKEVVLLVIGRKLAIN